VGFKDDAVLIPTERGEIEPTNETGTHSVFMTDLGEIFARCYPITGADLSVQLYILHLSNAKERLKYGETICSRYSIGNY